MKADKPAIPKGTRDFGPEKMLRRQFLLDKIRFVFEKFGYQPLETPAMEKLSVLTGKYGDEGDQLLFKVLNSGDFLSDSDESDFGAGSKKLLPKISEKGLRYDLTVPFARYVVMNQHNITFPFKRYQIQPVWRADRPQKGRYREFYQCDADIVGSNSLVSEAEFILMINEVMNLLGITDFTIKMNNRKLLTAMSEYAGEPEKESALCVAIDKLDKIGKAKVEQELTNNGFSDKSIRKLDAIFTLSGSIDEKIMALNDIFKNSTLGLEAVKELSQVFTYVSGFGLDDHHIELDLTLARGLSYYTGTILEVRANNSSIKSSITGGGRYDNLTGVFGLEGLSGAGFSFGVDRIYDVMEDLDLFPAAFSSATKLVLINFGEEFLSSTLKILNELRSEGIKCEIYPEPAKIKKQMNYANRKGVPYVLMVGEDELKEGKFLLKDMNSGDQSKLTLAELKDRLAE